MNRLLLIAGILMLSTYSMSAQLTQQEINWLNSTPEVKQLKCDSFDFNYEKMEKKQITVTPSIFKNKKIINDSKLNCNIRNNYERGTYDLLVKEQLIINEMSIGIYHSEGSGIIGNDYSDAKTWHTECKTDSMTDEYTCAIRNKDLVIIRDESGYIIVVGSSHFPDKAALIRLDKNKPTESGDKGVYTYQQSEEIVNGMQTAKAVTTRFIRWPYEKYVDGNVDMTNYTTAKKVLDLIYENHK